MFGQQPTGPNIEHKDARSGAVALRGLSTFARKGLDWGRRMRSELHRLPELREME